MGRRKSRFDTMLEELRKFREDSEKRWEEHRREHEKLIEEDRRRWEEHRREHEKLIEEDRRRWEEHRREHEKLIEEDRRRWEEHRKEQKELTKRLYKTLSKLGARIGIRFEGVSREFVREFLARKGVNKVRRLKFYDKEGLIYGYPSEVEVDVFCKEPLIVGEVKSIVDSVGDLRDFQNKVEILEGMYGRKAQIKFVACLEVEPKVKRAVREFCKRHNVKLLVES